MIARGPGRPEGSLPSDLPPSWREFVGELRRYRETSGLTLRDLADRARVSAGTLSKITSGSRLPSHGTLESLLSALGVEGEDKLRWIELFNAAVAERDAASVGPMTVLAVSEGSLSELVGTLKNESGLSIREIADRIASQGINVGKSSVDRALRDPGQSLPLSFHMAGVLIEELPEERRGDLRAALFRAVGDTARWPHQVGVIPHAAASFQHRAEATELRRVISDGDSVVLTGMGGAGKTQLAADYARDAWLEERVDVLVWVIANSRANIVTAFAQAGVEVCQADPSDPERAAQAFLAWLEPKAAAGPRRWLIVLDDVTDPNDLRGLWPPASPHGRALVTTRRQDAALSGASRQRVSVGVFTPKEAATYLSTSLAAYGRSESANALAALAADLGYLPLALAQAVAYLIDTATTAADYRTLLTDKTARLADATPDRLPDDHARPLAATWTLSIDHANSLRPYNLALPMLELAAFLFADGIPETVLTSDPALIHLDAHHPRRRPVKNAPSIPPEEAVHALRNLHRLSLIEHRPDDQTICVHPLVQRAIRDSLPPEQCRQLAHTAADSLLAAWPDDTPDEALVGKLVVNTFTLDSIGLDAAGEVHPVLLRAGRAVGQRGHAAQAFTYFSHLTDRMVAHLGPDHPDALAARFEAARWNGESGHWAEARTMLSSLLDDQIRVLGLSHPDTLTTEHEFARSNGETSRFNRAIAEFHKLLHHTIQARGHDHPDTLRVRRSRAHWFGESGHRTSAVTDLAELLPLTARILGPEHPDLLITRLLHSHWVGEAGEPAQAVDLLSQLLPDMVRILGDDHADTLTTLSELARWTGKSGNPTEAAAILDDVAQRMTRVLGQDHPSTLSARHNLAICQGNAGDAIGATSALAALLSRTIRALGSDRPRTHTTTALWRLKQQTTAGHTSVEDVPPRTSKTPTEGFVARTAKTSKEADPRT